jgi:hypothetical protein
MIFELLFEEKFTKKVKDISQELISGEINRISDNYVKYAGWFKE